MYSNAAPILVKCRSIDQPNGSFAPCLAPIPSRSSYVNRIIRFWMDLSIEETDAHWNRIRSNSNR